MQNESDDKAWWSDLFHGSTDPGSEVPADVWDSAVGAALDPDTPSADPNLVPLDDAESVADEFGDDGIADVDLGHPPHDSLDHDDLVTGDHAHLEHPSEGHVGPGDHEGLDHM
jgi:hypothetical protein